MRVLSLLHRVGPRNSIYFPLGFCAFKRPRLPNPTTMNMIFPDLTKADLPYNLFIPAEWKVAQMFVGSCNQVVSQVHAAGDVLGDVNVSIVGCPLCNDEVEINL